LKDIQILSRWKWLDGYKKHAKKLQNKSKKEQSLLSIEQAQSCADYFRESLNNDGFSTYNQRLATKACPRQTHEESFYMTGGTPPNRTEHLLPLLHS